MITVVKAPFEMVYKGFNQALFEYLLPPFGMAKLLRYEGQSAGDLVEIKFRIPFIGIWSVIIKEKWLSHREYGFIDRGLKVPFGIDYWQHTHRVIGRDKDTSFIIDDIEYETRWKLLDILLYLPLWFAFYPRKMLYQKYYNKRWKSKTKDNALNPSGFLKPGKGRYFSGELA